jgi:D-lactate dehydrogenase (cytochrome)
VTEQAQAFAEIASQHGGGAFQWATDAAKREQLWKARHDAYYAMLALRPGSVGIATDVCVPIARLAECIVETRRDAAASSLPMGLVGHVGDGNFHMIYVVDPNNPDEMAEAKRLNELMVRRALAMGGTSTGEHGVGYGKLAFMEAEHGEALTVMRALKQTLDPHNLMNPGKVLPS